MGDNTVEITKEKFLSYERLRRLGIINMFWISKVCELTGLSREEVLEIMRNYSYYRNKYLS